MQKASLEWLAVQDARDAAQKAGRKAPTVRKGLVNTSAVALCRLMALTGMRPGEAAALRWDEIDVSSQTMTLQDTKTGRSRRPLGRPALELMKAIERSSDRWVFPSNRGQRHSPHKKSLVELFRLASIDASPKVLRSTFASVAADLGYSGGTIGEMLGHARQGVTERHYIRRVDQVLIAAADEVSAAISAAMGT
ncbi:MULTISPECIES: tyrosine-type recombinase/integrase [unclassified Mesorhizobium]|uniref:tyrosine-type recombinase/integrase n=1 Tax=unclassified Mesorhizobium TaxID=325217 RepID=UPI001FEEF79B|nr:MULTISPECIES: tyrosine-type recombinase/integrase [unclassified Mesorhizobium]